MVNTCKDCRKTYTLMGGPSEDFFKSMGWDDLKSDTNLCPECYQRRLDNNKPIFTKNYCTQNGGDCRTCSLTNYNRDCRNNPLQKDE